MEQSRIFLKWACIVNAISSLIMFFTNPIFGIAYGALTYFIWYIIKEPDEILETQSTFLIFLGIVCLIINFISGVLIFIAIGKLKGQPIYTNSTNGPPKKIIKKVIDPEIRKIDILLKLGVGMVLISGILFATTTWKYINSETKASTLFILGLLFLFLSIFSEKRLKVYKTTYMYWLLSMAFFTLTIVGTLYFGIFSNELTYIGTKKELAYAITFLTIGGLTFASYLKFSKDYFAYYSYFSILIMIYCFLNAYFSPVNSTLIMSIILLLGNTLNKTNTKLLEVTTLGSYLSFILIIKNISDADSFLLFTCCMINIVNLYYLTITCKDNTSIIHLIVTLILSAIAISCLEVSQEMSHLIMFIYITTHTLLVKYDWIKQSKTYQNVNYAFYSIISIVNYIAIYSECKELSIIIAVGYLLMNIISEIDINKISYSPYLRPIAILAIVYSFLSISTESSNGYCVVITTIIYCFIHYLLKNKEYKRFYIVIIGIGIIIFLENNLIAKETIPTLLAIIPSGYLFLNSYQKRVEEKLLLVISYILLLLTIYHNLTVTNILSLDPFLSSIIFIWIIGIFILLVGEEIIKKISYFAIVVPLYDIINYLEIDVNLKSIASSIFILYIVFLIIKFFCKDNNSKNLAGVLGVIFSLTPVLFNAELVVAIYIGIIGILVILIGYYNSKELPSFFIMGIIITVVNILYQLQALWEEIQLWLYLLVGGLSILGFVTYKELSKTAEKENNSKEEKK